MYRYAILIILALLLLGACAELPVPAPLHPLAGMTATPTVTASPTVTPSPSPTPSPTPTPTPQPAELLARAERAYEVGDWESAQVLYERLLPLSSVPQEQAIEAALGLGKTLIAREAFTTGVTLLEDVASTVPDSPAASEAQLRMADAYMQMGRSEDAVPHYRAVLAAQPILAPYAHEWLGDALFASGIYTSALNAYTESLTLALTPSRQVFLWEKIALTHAARNDYAESLAAYDTILSIAQLPFYRARIAYQAAETARAFGDDEEALRRLREIIVSYPEEEEAYAALVQLVEVGEPVDDLLRGKIDYYAGAYGPAVQAFYRVINGDPDHTGEPHYFAGLSYLEAGSPQLALGEFEMLIETHPDDAYWGSSWIGKARSLLA
ncbi:MAG: tetratricopeptide repeat protein, partial [Anaerolineae bacterium]